VAALSATARPIGRHFIYHPLLAELAELRKPMDDANNTTGTLAADEDILTYTVSDEAIEAAAGVGGTTPMCTSVAVPCQSLDLKCIY